MRSPRRSSSPPQAAASPNGADPEMGGTELSQTIDRHFGRPAHAG